MHCPYCKGGKNGKDRYTFSINLKNGKFSCFRASCKANGNMITLSKDFDFSLGQQVDEYFKPKRAYKTFSKPKEKIKPKPQAIEYLLKRGISLETAEKYEITVQTNSTNILVFPFFDEKGDLTFIKYRKTDFNKEIDKNKEWCEQGGKPILFGMKQCTDYKRLVITEGQLDSLAVAECGINNAVSVPTGANGFTFIPYVWDWVNKFEELVIFGDYEKGRITLLEEFKSRFKKTIKHIKETDYKDCKDANDILLKYGKDYLRNIIENAVVVANKHIKKVSDVTNIDLFGLEKLKTGLSDLDRLLYGGLTFGGFCIIGGKRGEGKSTLGSQIVINAIEQGYKTLCYSGEMPDFIFKNWIDTQIAGSQHMVEYTNSFGDLNYSLSETNRNLITEWYADKLYLYDNRIVESDEQEDFLKTVEEAILQYGVRVILIDNLMTALDLDLEANSNLYDKQSKFCKKLAKLCVKYNVLIILVAHKRKDSFSNNSNDDISGSSDITNLATIMLQYGVNKDLLENQRLLQITKNRIFGKVNYKGWVMNFDEKSKRIYGDNDDKFKEYAWAGTNDGFENDSDIPFT